MRLKSSASFCGWNGSEKRRLCAYSRGRPAHDRDSPGLGHVPEAGLEQSRHAFGFLPGRWRDEPLALSASFGYLFDGIGFLRTVDGHSADPAHEGSEDARGRAPAYRETSRRVWASPIGLPCRQRRPSCSYAGATAITHFFNSRRKRPHELPPKHPEPYFPE